MKHKAKESLNHILYCDRDKPHSHISDAYRNDFSELDKLINCQLTVEEIDYLCLKLFGCKASNKYCLNWSSEKREEIQKSIEIKIMKQKEMLVSEDDY